MTSAFLPSRRVSLVLLAVSLVVFLVTAAAVALDGAHGFDAAIAGWVSNASGLPAGPDWLVEASRDFTSLGSYALLTTIVVIACAVLMAVGRWKVAAYLAAVSVVGTIVSSLLKAGFARPRPDISSGIKVFTASFPSGHATMSAAILLSLAAIIAWLSPNRSVAVLGWLFAILLTGIVGLTRIHLGVHYPTDVLAGWAVGASWALLCGLIVETVAGNRGGALTKS
ncbi:MAG TPA: phosphatase PAP2 family protein [Devosia sp.]|nr:phosphatase PAP2 family protein [Devosia sp.]